MEADDGCDVYGGAAMSREAQEIRRRIEELERNRKEAVDGVGADAAQEPDTAGANESERAGDDAVRTGADDGT